MNSLIRYCLCKITAYFLLYIKFKTRNIIWFRADPRDKAAILYSYRQTGMDQKHHFPDESYEWSVISVIHKHSSTQSSRGLQCQSATVNHKRQNKEKPLCVPHYLY